jgi:hypothetical protein
MGNADNKSEFITQLFLYYKPILSKEKQVQLLLDWMDSCLEKEEYEMAKTIKDLLFDVENDIDIDGVSDLSVVTIPDNVELVYEEDFINGKLPKIMTKKGENEEKTPKKPVKPPKKGWKWVNIWDEPYGFIVIDCQFSFKKRTFRLILLNYGFEFT